MDWLFSARLSPLSVSGVIGNSVLIAFLGVIGSGLIRTFGGNHERGRIPSHPFLLYGLLVFLTWYQDYKGYAYLQSVDGYEVYLPYTRG